MTTALISNAMSNTISLNKFGNSDRIIYATRSHIHSIGQTVTPGNQSAVALAYGMAYIAA
jgi:hypothetical protein